MAVKYSEKEFFEKLGYVHKAWPATIEEANDIVQRAKNGSGVDAERIFSIKHYYQPNEDVNNADEAALAKAIIDNAYDELFE